VLTASARTRLVGAEHTKASDLWQANRTLIHLFLCLVFAVATFAEKNPQAPIKVFDAEEPVLSSHYQDLDSLGEALRTSHLANLADSSKQC
jgi:hypothetical protein